MDKIVAIVSTYLKKEPLQLNQHPDIQRSQVTPGKEYFAESYQEAPDGHYLIKLGYGAGDWYIWSGHWKTPWEDHSEDDREPYQDFVTDTMLANIMPQSRDEDRKTYLTPLNRVLYEFEIATSARIAAFLAQIAHESGQLRYSEEIADGRAYEGRQDLGNIHPGDGKKYKGRGLIQLTGRANYRACGKALGVDLENNPQLAATDPYINCAIAGWFWQSRNLSRYADEGNFEKITRFINGGLNGYQDRLKFWAAAKSVLNVTTKIILPKSWEDIDFNDFTAPVSQYFKVREVVNGDRRRIPTDKEIKKNIFTLAQQLDRVRLAWKSPIIVTSWYRPPAINRAVGGASNSQHLYGLAVDVRPSHGTVPNFQQWLDRVSWTNKALGYGSPAFVHLDLRSGKIRWNY